MTGWRMDDTSGAVWRVTADGALVAVRPTVTGNVPMCGAIGGTMSPGGITCQRCLDTMRARDARAALEAARADEYLASGAVTAAWAALRVAEREHVHAVAARHRAVAERDAAQLALTEREAGR